MNISKAQIEQFYASPVWKEIEKRIKSEIEKADTAVENPDPFLHGKAVGERNMARVTLSYKDILLSELDQKGPYGNKANIL